jgi:hypothetical protein
MRSILAIVAAAIGLWFVLPSALSLLPAAPGDAAVPAMGTGFVVGAVLLVVAVLLWRSRSRSRSRRGSPSPLVLLVLVPFVIGACATQQPVSAPELVGHYELHDGIDTWSELDLSEGGTCVWWEVHAVGVVSRTPATGSWRLTDDAGIVDVECDNPQEYGLWPRPRRFFVRRYAGHVYLVPPDDVDWFDAHGPMHEFCFARDGAPMLVLPRP